MRHERIFQFRDVLAIVLQPPLQQHGQLFPLQKNGRLRDDHGYRTWHHKYNPRAMACKRLYYDYNLCYADLHWESASLLACRYFSLQKYLKEFVPYHSLYAEW